MRTPFPLFFVEKRGDTGSLTKKAGRNIPGSMGNALHFRQTGYDLSATSYATVRHDLLYFLRSERQTRGREAGAVLLCHGVTLATDFRQDNETPLQLQPELCNGFVRNRFLRNRFLRNRNSGGEASQAIGRVAREPREGEIPVELNQQPSVQPIFLDT